MVLPIEQRDVAIDLSKPVPVTMTNLLNLTHITPVPTAPRSAPTNYAHARARGQQVGALSETLRRSSVAFPRERTEPDAKPDAGSKLL